MKITFTEAVLDATTIVMQSDPNTILFGLGVNDERGLQGSTKDLVTIFGENRVFDIPIAEDAMMGFAVGSAIGGVRPIFNHARMDFLLLTFNQLFNVGTKYSYMFNGGYKVPMIIRCLVGFGWGAQHSQVLMNILSSFPGISVVCPSSPYDAKGLFIQAASKNYPIIFVEDFQLYSFSEDVPEGFYTINFDDYIKLSNGNNATIVTLSSASIIINKMLNNNQIINTDVFCLRSVTDLNYDSIYESIKRTGKFIFVQNSWMEFGLGANISREMLIRGLTFKYAEVGFPFTPTPFSSTLESHYYVSHERVTAALNSLK